MLEVISQWPSVIGAAAPAGIDPATVGLIIGSVIAALISGGVLGKKVSDSTKTTIDPQPLMVKMQDEFVTRREFDKLERSVNEHGGEMKLMFQQTLLVMERSEKGMRKALASQNATLGKKIEEVASGAYQSRQKIHVKVNEQGERIAKLEERIDVADVITEAFKKVG